MTANVTKYDTEPLDLPYIVVNGEILVTTKFLERVMISASRLRYNVDKGILRAYKNIFFSCRFYILEEVVASLNDHFMRYNGKFLRNFLLEHGLELSPFGKVKEINKNV